MADLASISLSQGPFQGSMFNAVTMAIAVVALIVTVATVYYQRRSLFPPKRRLSVTWLQPTPTLSKTTSTVESIQVIHNDVTLSDPYITTIAITNTGTRDIGSASFDQKRPIMIHLGVPVATIIDASSKSGNKTPIPTYALRGSEIHIGPDLLPRKQALVLQVLSEGSPVVECVAHLADTKLEVKKELPPNPDRQAPYKMVLLGSLFASLVAIGVVAIQEYVFKDPQPVVLVPVDRGRAAAFDPTARDIAYETIIVDRNTAAPGSIVVVKGDNFISRTSVDIFVNCPTTTLSGNALATTKVVADENGAFSTELPLPNDASMPNPTVCLILAQQTPSGARAPLTSPTIRIIR